MDKETRKAKGAGKFLLALMCLALLSGIAFAACPSNMVSYWKGEDNALDSSGNNNNGQLIGGLAFASGKVGRAFDFTAQGDYNNPKYFSDGTMLNPGDSTNHEFTLEAWVYPRANLGRLFDNGGYHHTLGTYIFGTRSEGTLRFAISDGGEPSWPGISTSNSALPLNQWSHVVGTAKQIGSNYEMRVYINGALNTAVNTTRFPGTWGQTLTLGIVARFDGAGQDRFNGLMDEVAIYSRALDINEIQTHYNSGNGIDYCEAAAPPEPTCPDGMVSYWKFDEGSGTTAADTTNTNPGTINGATWTTGKIGSALNFEGTQNVAYDCNNLPKYNEPFSVGFWYYKSNVANNDMAFIWRYYFGIYFNQGPDNIRFAWAAGGVTGAYVHKLNAWTYLFMTYDGNRVIKYYEDGVLMGTLSTGMDLTGGDGCYWHYIGNEGTGNAFDGKLDEFAIFNRALSDTEVQQLYDDTKNGVGGYCERAAAPPEPNLIQNDVGGTVTDQGITVTVPPGSLPTEELLVTIVPSTHSFAPVAGTTVIGQPLDIGPQCSDITDQSTCQSTNGCQWNGACSFIPFVSPVTISMPGDCSGTKKIYQQKIAKYIGTSWVPVVTCTPVNRGGGFYSCTASDGRLATWNQTSCMMSVQTNTFSTYAVIEEQSIRCPSDMVSYWRAENDTQDFVGTNHGTLQNGATFTSGKVGLAFLFDGSNDYVNVPDAPGLALENSQWTLVLWVRPTALKDVGNLFFKVTNGNEPGGWGIITFANGVWDFQIWKGWSGGGWQQFEMPAGSLQNGKWSFITITYDGTTARGYTDLISGGSWTGSLIDNSLPLTIGSDTYNTRYFNGAIDEVAIYNRILSTSELQELYSRSNANLSYCNVSAGVQPMENCTNGIDDDLDSLTDCADTVDCSADPACQVATTCGQAGTDTAGMVSYWKGDGDAKDSVGSSDGTWSTGEAYTTGKVNQAFLFAGTNKKITVNGLTAITDCTIEAWVKTSTPITGTTHFILWSWPADTSKQFAFGLDSYSNSLGYYPNAWTPMRNTPSLLVVDNQWHHVAVTKSGTTMKLYVDGNEYSTTGTLVPIASAAEIGYYWDGPIDELAVYDRALSRLDIQAHILRTNASTPQPYCERAAAPPAVCGNGAVEEDEQCDGSDLNDETCSTQGYFQGSLSCTDECTFDLSECQCPLPVPDCSKHLGVCAGTKQVCSGGSWIDCTEGDYQANSQFYSMNENSIDNCWDTYDNDCNGLADKDEQKCLPGGLALQPCTPTDMVDFNGDGKVDSFDALIVLRSMLSYPNQVIEPKQCEAVRLGAS